MGGEGAAKSLAYGTIMGDDAMDVVAEPDFVRLEEVAKAGFQADAARRLLDTRIIFSAGGGVEGEELASSIVLRCLPSLNRWIQWNITRRSFFHDTEGRMHLAMEGYAPDEIVAFRHLLRCLHFTGQAPLLAYLRDQVLTSGYILHLIVMANRWLHHDLVEQAQHVLIEFIVDTFLCRGSSDVNEALEALAFCDEIELDKSDLTGIMRAGAFGLRALSLQDLRRIDVARLARLPSDMLLHLIAFSGDPEKAMWFARAGLERIAHVIAPRCLREQTSRWKRHPADIHLSKLYLAHASAAKNTDENILALTLALQTLWQAEKHGTSLRRSHSEPEEALLRAAFRGEKVAEEQEEESVIISSFDESRVLRLVRLSEGRFTPHERFISCGVEYFFRFSSPDELSLYALNVGAHGLPKRLDVSISMDIDPRLEENVYNPQLVLKMHKSAPLPRADCELLVRCPLIKRNAATAEIACVIRIHGHIRQVSKRPRSWPLSGRRE